MAGMRAPSHCLRSITLLSWLICKRSELVATFLCSPQRTFMPGMHAGSRGLQPCDTASAQLLLLSRFQSAGLLVTAAGGIACGQHAVLCGRAAAAGLASESCVHMHAQECLGLIAAAG